MTPNASLDAAAQPVPGPVLDLTRLASARLDTPEALGHRFADCAAEGDLEGIVALYAADAVVSLPSGREAAGPQAIRAAFAAALAAGADLRIESVGRPIITGSLACTCSTDVTGRVHTQVARREPDGSWRWIRDGSRLREPVVPRIEHLG